MTRIQMLEQVLTFQKAALAELAQALRLTEAAIRTERAQTERADQLASYLTTPQPEYRVEATDLARLEEDE